MTDPVPFTLWFNPRCSKARGARSLLQDRGVAFRLRPYLEEPPTRAELDGLLTKLGTADPAVILRAKEPLAQELGVVALPTSEQLDAIAAHPVLLERPILEGAAQAVVARPPERVLELL